MTSSSSSLTGFGWPDHRPDIFPALTTSPWPASVKLDELDVICAVLGCGVEELLLPEPGKVTRPAGEEQPRQAAAPAAAGPAVTPRRRDGRSLPPP